EAYAPLTSKGSYCVVFDTIVEDLPDELCADRPWRRGNSPLTAVREYLDRLETHPRHGADGEPLRFRPDEAIENKLVLTVARGGFLRRV
ncbi:MAG: CmcI family methyltransferase, partial [Thermoanaerobaculia bacterium]